MEIEHHYTYNEYEEYSGNMKLHDYYTYNDTDINEEHIFLNNTLYLFACILVGSYICNCVVNISKNKYNNYKISLR